MIVIIYMFSDGSDYVPVSGGSVTVSPFMTMTDINVTVLDDPDFENDETFFVNFTGCSPGCEIPIAID